MDIAAISIPQGAIVDAPKLFYTYVLCRPNGDPFYIGKGTDDRIYRHEVEAKRGCACHKCNVIRKIWRTGGEIQRYTMLITEDEEEALAYEIELIAHFGQENLTNKTKGGDGTSGYVRSEAERQRISEAQKQTWADPKYRQRDQERWADPEFRENFSRQLKERWNSNAERKKKNAELTKQRWANPDYRARLTARLTEQRQTPLYRQQVQARMSAPEVRAEISERSKEMWKDPERLARANEKRKATWARKRAERKARGEDDTLPSV